LELSVQRNMSAPIEFDYVQYKGSKLSKSHSITENISSLQAELYEYIPEKESFIVRADVCTVDLVRLQNNFTCNVFTAQLSTQTAYSLLPY